MKNSAITAKRWHDALVEAGIVRQDDHTKRVVIDAQTGGLVTVYVERWGDTRLLQVIPTLDGIEVSHADA